MLLAVPENGGRFCELSGRRGQFLAVVNERLDAGVQLSQLAVQLLDPGLLLLEPLYRKRRRRLQVKVSFKKVKKIKGLEKVIKNLDIK